MIPAIMHLSCKQVAIAATSPATNIKIGDNITFTGKGFGEIAEVWCSTSYTGTYFRFPVVAQQPLRLL
jgi:hypothetical protein